MTVSFTWQRGQCERWGSFHTKTELADVALVPVFKYCYTLFITMIIRILFFNWLLKRKFFSFVSRSREFGNLVLRHSVLIKTGSLHSGESLRLCVLSGGTQPRFTSLFEWEKESIKFFISPSPHFFILEKQEERIYIWFLRFIVKLYALKLKDYKFAKCKCTYK